MHPRVEIVDNAPKYYDFMRQLRSDPRVASGFLEVANITAQQQQDYMARYSSCYLIALRDGKPAGYGGVVENDLRICVHPDEQGLGIGEVLLRAVLERFPGAEVRIRWGNEASLRLFAKVGYSPYLIIMREAK